MSKVHCVSVAFAILGTLTFTQSIASASPTPSDQCFSSQTKAEQIASCTAEIAAAPNGPALTKALTHRGLAYQATGQFQLAAADFTAVIKMKPAAAGIYDDRQAAYRAIGNLPAALSDADEAVKLAPRKAFVYFSRATVLAAMGRWSDAIADYNRSIAIDPNSAFRYLNKAGALERLSRYPDAIATLSAGLVTSPGNADLLKALATAKTETEPSNLEGSTSNPSAPQGPSETWFLSQDAATRSGIQADLILTGHYDALVDGNFGSSTFSALQAFQRSAGDFPTGVLSAADLASLHQEATSISATFGLTEVQDSSAGLQVTVPENLFPNPIPLSNGTSYSSPDGNFELQTKRVSGQLATIFGDRNTPTPNRTVTYSHLGDSSFTVTGSFNGRYFYDRFYGTGSDAVGFTLTWEQDVANRGTVLAAYLASFSQPLSNKALAQVASPPPQVGSPSQGAPSSPASPSETEVPLQPEGGTFRVPVIINSALKLDFTVDSGAADVTIPLDVMSTLIRTGTVSSSDITGTQTYQLADGSTAPSQTFIIRSLHVGDKTIDNVEASVSPVAGMLLLGQSFLTRFSSWSMDNSRHVLILGNVQSGAAGDQSEVGSEHEISETPSPATDETAPESSAEPSPLTGLSPQAQPPASTGRLALYEGLDFYGNDIFKGRVADAVHCAAACLGDGRCEAFTFNANPKIHSGPNCFLKGSVNHLEAYSTAIGGLLLQAGQSAPQYNFDAIDPTTDLLVNRDMPGGDLSNYPYALARTLDDCRMACDDNQRCEALSYVASLHQCWLKGISGASRPVRGIISGAKRHVSLAAQDVISVPR